MPALLSIGFGLALRFLVPIPEGITLQAWTLLSIFASTIAGQPLQHQMRYAMIKLQICSIMCSTACVLGWWLHLLAGRAGGLAQHQVCGCHRCQRQPYYLRGRAGCVPWSWGATLPRNTLMQHAGRRLLWACQQFSPRSLCDLQAPLLMLACNAEGMEACQELRSLVYWHMVSASDTGLQLCLRLLLQDCHAAHLYPLP